MTEETAKKPLDEALEQASQRGLNTYTPIPADELPFWRRANITPRELAELLARVAELEKQVALGSELADLHADGIEGLTENAKASVDQERQWRVEVVEALGTFEHLVFFCDGNALETWEEFVKPVLGVLRKGLDIRVDPPEALPLDQAKPGGWEALMADHNRQMKSLLHRDQKMMTEMMALLQQLQRKVISVQDELDRQAEAAQNNERFQDAIGKVIAEGKPLSDVPFYEEWLLEQETAARTDLARLMEAAESFGSYAKTLEQYNTREWVAEYWERWIPFEKVWDELAAKWQAKA